MLVKKIKEKWPLVLGLILSVILLWPLFARPFFTNQADLQTRLLEMDKCFKDGQIPCRWVADLGYGSPLFNYSAPLPYYFGESIFLLTNNLSFSVSTMLVFLFLGSLGILYFLYKSWSRFNLKKLILFALGVAFLVTSYSRAILIVIPLILIFITFSFLKNRQIKYLSINLVGLMLGLTLASFYILPLVFEKNLVHMGFLPIYTKEQSLKPVPSRYQILTGDSLVSDFKEGTNWISFKANTKTHTIIRLSQYYFPEWKVFVDGSEIKVDYINNSLGLMTFILGEGKHTIYAKFFDTPIRTIANLITMAGFVITLLLFILSFAKVRKWISYYKKGIS